MDKRVFALGPKGIGEPMVLRHEKWTIKAFDSTGAHIATAHYISGIGWTIVNQQTREVVGKEQYKPDAERALREIVGLRKR
ncbi:hypothetical protein [Rhodococcus phage REQ1]|uniref:hypothetical protein n=1 Tax=Rhodococcus phage REQ1 TaxID=1109712 RepID=UPI00023EEBE6|nr:hypothetical protein RoPhREQ1_gp05 [Rhodococcus phage REQ1]AEV52001.1 hypothetical protein [Rhodococcus phage REQ1]